MVEVGVGRGDSVPIQLNTSSFSSFCGLLKVTLDDGSFFIMVGDPSAMVLEAVDEVLASPRVDTEVKEFVLASPSLRFAIRDGCLFLARSATARAMTLRLSLLLRSISSGSRVLDS